MHPWPFLCVALAFAQNALAVNQFRRPAADGPTGDYSENPAYEVGKDITFLWDTDFDQIDLVVWSDASDKLKTSLYKRLAVNLSSRAYTWKPSFDGFPAEAKTLGVFYLTFYQAGTVKQAAQSHYLNITDTSAASASASASAPATTSKVTSTSVPTSAGTATTPTAYSPPSSTSSPSASTDAAVQQDGSDSSGSGLSAGAVAGIAIGAALGTLLAAGAAAFLAWKRHQKKNGADKSGPGSRGSAAFGDAAAQGYYAPSGYAPSGQYTSPASYTSPSQYGGYSAEWKSPTVQPVELATDRTPELGGGTEHVEELSTNRRSAMS
ncbi:hypothetical protein CGCSCA5_v005447 [Colletotrichum siamense]|nr:hypothetical protein CGCSCA5_v005447 [Colletotrichum siamense]